MGVQVAESSEFRLLEALFWYEIDEDHMLWFVIENGSLIAKTYSKIGEHIGEDRIFATGITSAHSKVVYVEMLDTGQFIVNRRELTDSGPYDSEVKTYYDLYSAEGEIIRRDEYAVRTENGYVENGYFDLTDGSKLQISTYNRFELNSKLELSIFDASGAHTVVNLNIASEAVEEGRHVIEWFDDAVVMDNGQFAVFTYSVHGQWGEHAVEYSFEIFDASGRSLSTELHVPTSRVEDSQFADYDYDVYDYDITGNGNFIALHSYWYDPSQEEHQVTLDLEMIIFNQQGDVVSKTVLRHSREGYWKVIDARITHLDGGGWVVTWGEGWDLDNVGKSAVRFFQIFDEHGTAISQRDTIINSYNDLVEDIDPYFLVTPLSDGGFVATWRMKDQESADYGPLDYVWMQRAYDGAGNALTKAFSITDFEYQSYVLGVEPLDDGGWVTSFGEGKIKEFHVSDLDHAPVAYDVGFYVEEDGKIDIYKTFIQYIDQDGDKILGVEITKMPELGKIVLEGEEIRVGDVIPWSKFATPYYDSPFLYYQTPKDINGIDVTSIAFRVLSENGAKSNEAFLHANIDSVVDVPTSSDFEITIKEDSAVTLSLDMFFYQANESGEFTSIETEAAYVKWGTYGLWRDFLNGEEIEDYGYMAQANEFGDNYGVIRFRVGDDQRRQSDWYEITVNVEEVMDTINGTRRRDVMTGIDGSNKLVGKDGNDTFQAGSYDDIYVGGEGRDRFVFVAGGGSDKVKDFTHGEDMIDVSAIVGVHNLRTLRSHLSQADGKVTIHFEDRDDGDNTLVLEHTRIKDMDKHDFVF